MFIPAFTFRDDKVIYCSDTGQPLKDYHGLCLVHFPKGRPYLFNTGINKAGERFWSCCNNLLKEATS